MHVLYKRHRRKKATPNDKCGFRIDRIQPARMDIGASDINRTVWHVIRPNKNGYASLKPPAMHPVGECTNSWEVNQMGHWAWYTQQALLIDNAGVQKQARRTLHLDTATIIPALCRWVIQTFALRLINFRRNLHFALRLRYFYRRTEPAI